MADMAWNIEAWPCRLTAGSGIGLNLLDLRNRLIEDCHRALVHLLRVVTLDKAGYLATAAEELVQLLVLDPRQDLRVADLEAAKMRDQKYRLVMDSVGIPI
jgi:hypothetical protein